MERVFLYEFSNQYKKQSLEVAQRLLDTIFDEIDDEADVPVQLVQEQDLQQVYLL